MHTVQSHIVLQVVSYIFFSLETTPLLLQCAWTRQIRLSFCRYCSTFCRRCTTFLRLLIRCIKLLAKVFPMTHKSAAPFSHLYCFQSITSHNQFSISIFLPLCPLAKAFKTKPPRNLQLVGPSRCGCQSYHWL